MENQSNYLFDLSFEDQYEYAKNNLSITFSKDDIKQIECDHMNIMYILLNDGSLYKNQNIIQKDIDYIWSPDVSNVYSISLNKIIINLNNNGDLSNYINNNGEPYQKILTNNLYLLALTKDKQLKFIGDYYYNYGIDPFRFINIDDIIIKGDLGIPYVIKEDKEIPLFIENEKDESIL